MKKEKFLICGAWPFAYDMPHLGNLMSCALSGDVIARYLRISGNDVLFVSGSDEHGARMEFGALKKGITPKQLVDKVHKKIKNMFKEFGISYDNYTRTSGEFHKKFVTEFYKKIYANGFITTKIEKKPFCKNCDIFLTDRFIEGACPHCKKKGAKGNQCDACQKLLEPEQLIDPYCCVCKKKQIEMRKTKHWYIKLDKFEKKLKEWVKKQEHWPDNAKKFTENWIAQGLEPKPVTRDLKWGIPAPFPGAEGKVMYVWSENILGYLSATAEIEKNWKAYWMCKECKQIYAHAKDNVPFHTVLLPALLLATKDKYALPWQMATSEYLNWEGGEKFSKTHQVGVWCHEALKLLPPDYWRFYLLYNRPERKDTNFSWQDFETKINNELLANLGNFVNRTLSFTHTRFNAGVPKKHSEEKRIEKEIKKTQKTMEKIKNGELKDALKQVLALSDFGNKYFQEQKPWETIKTKPEKAENAIHHCIKITKALAIFLHPFLPFSAAKIWAMLGQKRGLEKTRLKETTTGIKQGKIIQKPEILFKKIDKKELTEKIEKMRRANRSKMN